MKNVSVGKDNSWIISNLEELIFENWALISIFWALSGFLDVVTAFVLHKKIGLRFRHNLQTQIQPCVEERASENSHNIMHCYMIPYSSSIQQGDLYIEKYVLWMLVNLMHRHNLWCFIFSMTSIYSLIIYSCQDLTKF